MAAGSCGKDCPGAALTNGSGTGPFTALCRGLFSSRVGRERAGSALPRLSGPATKGWHKQESGSSQSVLVRWDPLHRRSDWTFEFGGSLLTSGVCVALGVSQRWLCFLPLIGMAKKL